MLITNFYDIQSKFYRLSLFGRLITVRRTKPVNCRIAIDGTDRSCEMLYSHYLLFSFFFTRNNCLKLTKFYSAVTSKEKRIMQQNLILILTPWKYVVESVIIYFHNFVVFTRH